MSKYEVTPIDGVWTYGPAHDRRQTDAEQALAMAGDDQETKVLTVFCAKAHTLATVHAVPTDDPELKYVVRIPAPNWQTPDLRQINRQLDLGPAMRAMYDTVDFVDPLRAPDDRDLEARCRCGFHRLDRAALVGATDNGDRELVVSPS